MLGLATFWSVNGEMKYSLRTVAADAKSIAFDVYQVIFFKKYT